MTFAPLVSVIVPCYNYGRFLGEALDSLLDQTYANWECLIVDDGSTDNTREVSLLYASRDKRFTYIHQENKGLAGARNRALQQSKGAFIQLLDADDMLEAHKLELQVNFFAGNPQVGLVYSRMLIFNDSDKQQKIGPKLLYDKDPINGKGEFLIHNLQLDNFFLPGCIMIKRAVYEQVGGFRTGMGGLEDWNYWFRIALNNFEFYCDTRPGTCLLVRNHGDNMSGNIKKMLFSRIKAREDILQYMRELQQQPSPQVSSSFLSATIKQHQVLMVKDKVRYNLYYAGLAPGLKAVLQHAYYSGKPFYAAYDGLYWIKERLKSKLQQAGE